MMNITIYHKGDTLPCSVLPRKPQGKQSKKGRARFCKTVLCIRLFGRYHLWSRNRSPLARVTGYTKYNFYTGGFDVWWGFPPQKFSIKAGESN